MEVNLFGSEQRLEDTHKRKPVHRQDEEDTTLSNESNMNYGQHPSSERIDPSRTVISPSDHGHDDVAVVEPILSNTRMDEDGEDKGVMVVATAEDYNCTLHDHHHQTNYHHMPPPSLPSHELHQRLGGNGSHQQLNSLPNDHLGQSHDNQKISIDRAVAPILDRPVAPFGRTERKKAATAAIYYSECVLQGIAPKVADKAAEQADDLHDKWWRRQCATKNSATTATATTATNSVRVGSNTQIHNASNKRESVDDTTANDHDDNNTSYDQAAIPCKTRRVEVDSNLQSTGRHSHVGTQSLRQERHVAMEDEPSDSSAANFFSLSSSTFAPGTTRTDMDEDEGTCSTKNNPNLTTKNHPLDGNGDSSVDEIMQDVHVHSFGMQSKYEIETVKMRMINDLRQSGGSATTPVFLDCLTTLQHYYEQDEDCITRPDDIVGNWVVLTKPTYSELLGYNGNGEPLYTLGRISFDMYRPTNLACSVQGSFNSVQPIDPKNPGRPLHVPKRLIKDIHRGYCNLHTYDISVAITIEEGQDQTGKKIDSSSPPISTNTSQSYVVPRPIKAIMTTHGYSVRDPSNQNRLSIWFSGGSLEVQDDEDLVEWKNIFDMDSAPDRDIRERANILAARVLLGAMVPDNTQSDDGTMSFALRRPIGGHGSVYLDVLYRDEDFRLMRGHHGSVYAMCRVPDHASR